MKKSENTRKVNNKEKTFEESVKILIEAVKALQLKHKIAMEPVMSLPKDKKRISLGVRFALWLLKRKGVFLEMRFMPIKTKEKSDA